MQKDDSGHTQQEKNDARQKTIDQKHSNKGKQQKTKK
jgi:hypothetical protein